MPSSTLPVRSAAMSAVLVKMPPPALANSARELAPKLKAMTASESPVARYRTAAPSSELATTAMPITAPPRKPAMYAGARPCRAAEAERVLASVATLMPI